MDYVANNSHARFEPILNYPNINALDYTKLHGVKFYDDL
jgi:hypothetical protein